MAAALCKQAVSAEHRLRPRPEPSAGYKGEPNRHKPAPVLMFPVQGTEGQNERIYSQFGTLIVSCDMKEGVSQGRLPGRGGIC